MTSNDIKLHENWIGGEDAYLQGQRKPLPSIQFSLADLQISSLPTAVRERGRAAAGGEET